jgi:hypothetical protein
MSHKPHLLALGTLFVCICETRVANSQEYAGAAIPVTSTAPIVNSGQESVVDQKLAALAELSLQAAKRPPVIESGTRTGQLLAATAAVEAVRAVKARGLEEFRDSRFVAVYQKLNEALKSTGEKDLEYKTASNGQRAVTSVSFYEVLDKIADLVKKTTNQADVRTTFLVHTDPAGAAFEICPQYLSSGCIQVTTDATIAAIFRGLYTYRVSLDGYKTVTYPLDLVHFTQTRLDCRLQAQKASPCTPR